MFQVLWIPGGKLNRIESMLNDPADALDLVGHELIYASREAFRRQEWDGKPWEPRPCPNVIGALADLVNGRDEPKPHRLLKGPALIDTGDLMNSLAFNRIDRYSILHGSNKPYSRPHDQGEPSSVGPITKDVQTKLYEWMKRVGLKRDVCGTTISQAFGWLLNKKKTGATIEVGHPQRQFVGLTDDTRETITKGLRRLVKGI